MVKQYSILVPMHRKDFVALFKDNMDEGNNSLIEQMSEYFSTSKNKYVGRVDYYTFHFRKRKAFFSFDKNTAIVKGKFREKGNTLYMEAEIQAFSTLATGIYVFLALFFMYWVAFTLVERSPEPAVSILSTILFQSLLLLGIPYWVAKSRMKRMYVEFQKDVYGWLGLESLFKK